MSALGESASRGSMIGSTVGQLAPLIYGSLKGGSLLAGLGMALNPWAALAIGLAGGVGKYLGGRKEAKAIDKKAEALDNVIGRGYDPLVQEVEGQSADLKKSAIKQGVTEGIASFMLAGGGKMLGSVGKQGQVAGNVNRMMSGKIPADVTQIVKQITPTAGKAPSTVFQPMTLGQYYSKQLGKVGTSKSLEKALAKYTK